MNEAVFHPKSLGLSKAQVVDMILERVEEGTIELDGLVKPDKFTDARMQQFVDEYFAALELCGEMVFMEHDKLLEELAKEIS